jgi:light-regulated signal transduction histidine kinase (bacteriophytochrome)
MPKLDGVDVCRALRAKPCDNPPYLIMLTVSSGRNDILDGLKSGVDDYITKPFDDEALVARIKIGERILGMQTTLARRVRDLEQSNQELEAFGRMVAHDLRNPLGAIEMLADVLKEEATESGAESLLPHIADIAQSSVRARETIEDLLKLSRAALSELKVEEVDLSEVVRSISADLTRLEPDRQVEWRIAPEVQVRGDAGLLRLALENLVRNAWKFSKRRAPAQIAFGSLGEGENSILFLRDNGAGFDMTKAQKLFGAFQRLHQQRDYEGTGIGLTIVKRIVERHGGRIWVQAAPELGATFFFTVGSEASISRLLEPVRLAA